MVLFIIIPLILVILSGVGSVLIALLLHEDIITLEWVERNKWWTVPVPFISIALLFIGALIYYYPA